MQKIIGLLILLTWLWSCSPTSSNQAYVHFLEGETKQISTLIGGQLINMSVAQGDYIEKNQLLAVVDTTYLHLELTTLEATLREISQKIALLQVQEQQARRDQTYWQDKCRRIEELYQSGGTSLQNVEDSQNAFTKMETALKAVQLQIQQAQTSRMKAETQRETILQKIKDAHIVAPFSGQVTECFYQTGEMVAAYRPLLEVMDAENFEIRLYVSAVKLTEVQLNQTVDVWVQGVPQPIKGTISWISNQAEFTPKEILTPETQSDLVYAVVVKVVDPQRRLKDGLPAEVRL